MSDAKPIACTARGHAAGSALEDLPVEEVWREYRRTGADAYRDRLVRQYLPIVRYLAHRERAKLAVAVDVNDLIQDGYCGLMDAIEAFDPALGVKFETFCPRRIRGAMLDALRSADLISRVKRERERVVERTRQRFFARFGRFPTDEEILSLLDADPAKAWRILRDGRPIRFLSLGRPRFAQDPSRDECESDTLADGRQVEPPLALRREEIKSFITRALSRAERLILILYYYEDMSMKEIGWTLDLSESRVSQMHASIMKRLRARCRLRPQEFDEQ